MASPVAPWRRPAADKAAARSASTVAELCKKLMEDQPTPSHHQGAANLTGENSGYMSQLLAIHIRTDIILAGKRKLLCWEDSSKKDFKEFPIDVQMDMGVALLFVQLGSTPPSAKLGKGSAPVYTNWWKTTGAIPSGQSIQ
jgi:hypothetical protein